MTGKRVLIVEDDAAIIELLCFLLEQEGLEVEVARDGLEALDKMETFSPDLVLLDLRLPKLEGMDVLWEMRQNPRWNNIPAVIISVDSSPQTMLQGWRLGVDSYFIKPFDPDELIRVVRRILSVSRPEPSLNP
ncbi:response regulator transcription factor [Fervidibacter sacchari]|uniref:DNA-binding response OmpR family regulator n=1 Tax=Candidatus Fervidibacter sacchari TaxID=1448929 RepID=A0ABT2EQ91_9BACT|nr:response regulator transcription factor [Candidatus Fervidibacter sacchari]MCS3920097.1 DNA-binding response OmpR family regulator [Candidatus Fervidibacter sacchari]WKU16672.1 response regulator transcription factor [Candidatus Fervidibacter sacchari]